MMGSSDFVEEVRRQLNIGDRQIRFKNYSGLGGPKHYYETVFITLINLPEGIGGAGGGAEAANNRVLLKVDGFDGADEHAPPPTGKVKLEALACEALSREQVKKYLRGKSGTPEAIVKYAADALNHIVEEVPPKFTHTRF